MRGSFTDNPKVKRIAAYDRHRVGSFKHKPRKVYAKKPPKLKGPRKKEDFDDFEEQWKEYIDDY